MLNQASKLTSFVICGLLFAPQTVLEADSVVPHLYVMESGGQVSFLFGTRHDEIPLDRFPDFVLTAFQSKTVVATEVVTVLSDGSSAPSPPSSQPPPERPLPSPSAVMALRARGIPDYLFTSPWICSFYYSWQPGKIPYLDLAFEQLARSMHKVVEGLDEPRDLKIINDSGEQAVSDCDIEIATQVFSAEALKAREEEALNRYFTGDPNQIKPCDLDQNCSERTKAWIPKIERLHRDKGVFAFVGVAHLVGDGGLVKLLRDRHHRVIQVKNAEQLKAILDREVRR